MTIEEQIEFYEAQKRAADEKLLKLKWELELAPPEDRLDIAGQIFIWQDTKEVAEIALWGLRGNWENRKR